MRIMCRHAVAVLVQKVIQVVASLVLLCAPFYTHAIVSMENIHLGKPPEGFTGSYDLDLSVESGNTEQAGAATGIKLQWQRNRITDFILADYAYAETDGVRNKNKAFVHFRHIHQRDDQYAWEGFTQFSSNEFTKLLLRTLLGGGVRLTLGEVTDTTAFFLGLGAFYEKERLDTQYPDEADTEQTVRASTYLVMKYQFNEHVTLVSSTYYQPALNDFADYRAVEDLSITSRLGESLSLKVGINIAHDSKPLRDVKETDASMNVGIVVNF